MTGLSFRLSWPVIQVTIASPVGAWQSLCRSSEYGFAGVLADSLRYSSPATHRQTLSAKGTARNSASMHSVLAARNILFLAPLRSPQFRRVLRRLVVSRSSG